MTSKSILANRYKMLSPIGQGGMQSVTLASDKLTDRSVAVKTPLPGQGGKKFVSSAIIAAMVNHHNVAKTLDYFEEDGVPYLVEEYVDGPNLEESITNGQFLDPHGGARLFRWLSLGVAASHAAGVVHRDLKPSNVISVGGFLMDEIKITDFGIATLTDDVFSEAVKTGDITKSTSGTVKGALPFMSPEMMFRKKGDHPSEPADVWSLGAMMFRLLTGSYPFGTGFDAVANVSKGARSAWPSFMTSDVVFADLSLELQGLVEDCLLIDAASRPSAAQLVDRCSNLCFSSARREGGVATDMNGKRRFLEADVGGERVFYHRDSVYGRPTPSTGDRLVFSAFAGSPWRRAHPVTVMKVLEEDA